MSRKRRSTPSMQAAVDLVVEPAVLIEAPEAVAEPVVIAAELAAIVESVVYTVEAETVTEAEAVQKSVEIPSDEALAIRRLRNTLIQKLFTPDRTQNSWTDLRATN